MRLKRKEQAHASESSAIVAVSQALSNPASSGVVHNFSIRLRTYED